MYSAGDFAPINDVMEALESVLGVKGDLVEGDAANTQQANQDAVIAADVTSVPQRSSVTPPGWDV